jgi:Ankyrin repeats (3 copies)/Ankyrin repeats (many copies)
VYLDFVGYERDIKAFDASGDASSASASSAQASDAPLPSLPPSTPDGAVVAAAAETRGQLTPPAETVQENTAAGAPVCTLGQDGEPAPAVEARVWFAVLPPPPPTSPNISSTASSSPRSEAGDAETCSSTSSTDAAKEWTRSHGSDEEELEQPAAKLEPVVLKDCCHRFISPDNDWGFRELMPATRAREYLDEAGALVLEAHVVVFSQLYTNVRDKILAASSIQRVNWLEVVDLVNRHKSLAATAVTRVGLSAHNDGASLVHAACKAKSLDYCQLLVARGASTAVEDDSGRTPLVYAARSGALDVVRWLVEEQGADVNAKDSENRSPIFYACEEGCFETVKYLVERRAEISGPDFDGDTPVRLAEGRGHDNIVALLRSLVT